MAAKIVTESSADWTEPVMTRVSARAKGMIERKLAALQGVSHAAYVRQLIYRDLGLVEIEGA